MTQSKLIGLTLILAPALFVLNACGASETSETAHVDPVTTVAVQTTAPLKAKSTPPADTGFQSACTDKITAKMIDPNAVDVAYTPLTGDEGYEANVTFTRQDGGTVNLDFTCRRDANGEITTKMLAD